LQSREVVVIGFLKGVDETRQPANNKKQITHPRIEAAARMQPPRSFPDHAMSFLTSIFSILNPPNYDRLDYLLESSRHDSASRDEFYRLLLDSTLHVPGKNIDGEMYIQSYDLDGRHVVLVFTSEKRLREGLRELPPSFTMRASELLPALPPYDRLVLNYRTRMQKEFTPSEVQAILDGTIFDETREVSGDGLVIGQPKVQPVKLMEALKEKLPAREDVRAAYLAQLFDSRTMSEPHPVIAFETDMSDEDFETLRSNASRLAEACEAGDILFMRLEDDAIGEYMRHEVRAFYERL
jgi:hypothetical protein